jgi:hypothetical protein
VIRTDIQTGSLLLKHTNRETVYRHQPRAGVLSQATPEEWLRAGGPIAECGKQTAPPQDVLRIEQQSHQLVAGQRHLSTAGRNALSLAVSPGNRFAAVLSAAGEIHPSILPALGAGGAAGQHYHQLVSLPDGAVVGKAVRIPVGRDYDVLTACWSLDSRAVVYSDVVFSYLSIVEIAL